MHSTSTRQSLVPHRKPKVTFSSAELSLFAAEDKTIYGGLIVPAVDQLARKLKNGSYNPVIAESAFYPIARHAALQYEEKHAVKPRNHGDPAVREALEKTLTQFSHEDVTQAALLLLHQYINDIADKADELP